MWLGAIVLAATIIHLVVFSGRACTPPGWWQRSLSWRIDG
jgi:hypothetical protein